LIKDLRTDIEIGDVDRILDGDLDEFIKANLLLRKSKKQNAESSKRKEKNP
jgi:peptide chain release factor 2